MKTVRFAAVIFTMLGLLIATGCKTSDVVIDVFSVVSTTGYSKTMKTLDPDDEGVTSINLYVAIKNTSSEAGTIVAWRFKIRHNIVTLVEINQNNYTQYNLQLSGGMNVSAEDVAELYVATPQPFLDNSLNKNQLNFDPHIPSRVVVEIDIRTENGDTTTITGGGQYAYETGTINESRFDVLGNWEFQRRVDGNQKAKQKLVCVGTKKSGQFVLYNKNTNEVMENGSFVVTNFINLKFTSSDGTQYWGEFNKVDAIDGTLLIPADGTDDSKTGTWTGTKLKK